MVVSADSRLLPDVELLDEVPRTPPRTLPRREPLPEVVVVSVVSAAAVFFVEVAFLVVVFFVVLFFVLVLFFVVFFFGVGIRRLVSSEERCTVAASAVIAAVPDSITAATAQRMKSFFITLLC